MKPKTGKAKSTIEGPGMAFQRTGIRAATEKHPPTVDNAQSSTGKLL